jgi:NAD(P)-dependent dehydrogenase (short-subunit alcohol dehydrogenase family)
VKHVLIVGGTDGLGLALVREYLGRGARVCVVGRDPEKLERALAGLRVAGSGGVVSGVVCDVTDIPSIDAAFEAALSQLGHIDLLVYCAGVMRPASSPEERLEGAAEMLEVNTLGAIHFLERGAEHLEAVGRGRLAAVGSIAGVRGRRGNPVYGASKAALHAYLDGLRHRLHPAGVGVTTIKPGFVRTRMLPEATPRFPPALPADDAARRIANGLDRGRDEFFVPWWWSLVAVVLRILPVTLYKRFAPP